MCIFPRIFPRALGVLLSASSVLFAQSVPKSGASDLVAGFVNPPLQARPLTWWHWVSGFVSKEGITADLESMKRVGLGGAQMFTVTINMRGPDGEELRGPVAFMSPEWRELVKHAVAESDRLGLEFSILQAQGWGQAGGETVPAAETTQKVVWTERPVTGGQKVSLQLAQPETRINHYADIALLAFPAIKGDEVTAAPKITSSQTGNKVLTWSQGAVSLPLPMPDAPQWVQLAYEEPQTFSSITTELERMRDTPDPESWERTGLMTEEGKELLRASKGPKRWEIQVSEDGVNFRSATPVATHGTTSFEPVTGKIFRVFMPVPPPLANPLPLARTNIVKVLSIKLAGPRLDKAEARAGRITDQTTKNFSTMPVAAGGMVAADKVIDLTGKTEWDAPAGNWTLVRIGHTSTEGHLAAAASPTALEADKMSKTAILNHLNTGVTGAVLSDNKAFVGKTLKNLLCDSWERGDANWTPRMKEEFLKRRGYAIDPWLPTLTGRIVNSPEQSERFLWDFRRTIADLIAENYYGTLKSFANAHKMEVYAEAAGHGLPAVVDQISNKANTDVPMGEFWVGRRDTDDTKEASSAAHIFGKPIVAAESFTADTAFAAWARDPASLKAEGDLQFCVGVNRYCFHRFTHQPWLDRAPGMTMGGWGTNFDRTNTWWEQVRGWVSYISRCEFLLQQGQFVADACYFYGEDAPVGFRFSHLSPKMPAGYDFDAANAEAVKMMSVKDGLITVPSGMRYRVLVLPEQDRMTAEVADKIRELVKAGATVVGPKPKLSPSLSGYPQNDEKVQAIAQEVWGNCDGQTVKSHAYGAGKVVWGVPLTEVLGVPPDFSCGDANLRYIHRRDTATEIYFISNQSGKDVSADCRFRVDGLAPEFWHPKTGKIETAAMYSNKDGRTTVPIRLKADGSIFVVFRKPASPDPIATVQAEPDGVAIAGVPANKPPILANGKVQLTAWQPGKYTFTTAKGRSVAGSTGPIPQPIELGGAWELRFPPKLGAPATTTLEKLVPWNTSVEEGIKYFSGTATYLKEFTLPNDWLRKGARIYLDLGKVMNLAEVKVNGTDLGVLWTAPFRTELTQALKAGNNTLEVKVTNLWPNRMIGDLKLPPEKRFTWTSFNPYKKDSPLLESGLLGPVRIEAAQVIEVTP